MQSDYEKDLERRLQEHLAALCGQTASKTETAKSSCGGCTETGPAHAAPENVFSAFAPDEVAGLVGALAYWNIRVLLGHEMPEYAIAVLQERAKTVEHELRENVYKLKYYTEFAYRFEQEYFDLAIRFFEALRAAGVAQPARDIFFALGAYHQHSVAA